MEICLVLHNIRSTYNVGAILRTAEGFGVTEVILSGITPRVDDPKLLPHLREKLNHQIGKTALGAEKMVKISLVDNILGKLREWREDGWQVVGLENNIQDERLVRLGSAELRQKLQEGAERARRAKRGGVATKDDMEQKVVLVLGEEVDGISAELFPLMDLFVEIPMAGRKESFNVSVATGVAIWGLLNA